MNVGYPIFFNSRESKRNPCSPHRAKEKKVQTVNLRKMLKNQKGTIKSINVSGELGRRIREMGMVPGTEIAICGRAPLYDPVAVKVMDVTITLRNNEADHIFVTID